MIQTHYDHNNTTLTVGKQIMPRLQNSKQIMSGMEIESVREHEHCEHLGTLSVMDVPERLTTVNLSSPVMCILDIYP